MSVCPIGLAIVLAACGAPEAQRPAPPKAPAAVVRHSENPSLVIENLRWVMAAEEAKRSTKAGKAVLNLAPDRAAPRSRSRGMAATRPCREMKSAPRGPDS
ncbi:MAG: hypothetical protein WBE76_07140 [Terracidiphilus sp.]